LSKVDNTSRQALQPSKVWQSCCCHGSSLRLFLRCCYSRLLCVNLRLGCLHLLLLLLVLLHVCEQHLDLLGGSASSARCLQQLLQRCSRHLH
jgi:hypothetical protein